MNNSTTSNKRIAKNTMMLYVRQLFSMVVSLFTAGIVLRTLGVDNYGIYNVVGGIVAMFSFLQGAMSTSTQRYMNIEMGKGNFDRLQKVFSTSLVIHCGIAIVVLIFAETIGLWFVNTQLVIPADRMVAANWVYQFSVFSTVLFITQSPYTAAIIANEKMGIYGYLGIAETLMRLVVLYLLVTIDMDKLTLYALLAFAVSTLFLAVYRGYCLHKFPECHFVRPKEKQLFKDMAGFSGWNLFGSLASVCMNQGQNILLNLFFGPVVNAARAVAMNVNGAIIQFNTNFMVAVNPQITKSYAAGDHMQVFSLIFRSSKLSFFLLFIISAPIILQIDYILDMWLKTPPEYAAAFCRLTLIDSLIVCVSVPLMTGAQATGKIKLYQAFVGGILLLNLPAAYITLKYGAGPVSIYFVTITISLLALFGRLLILRKLLLLPVRKFVIQVLCRCWTLFALTMGVFFYLWHPSTTTIIELILNTLICFVACGIAIGTLGISQSEREFIFRLIKNKIKS